LRTDNGGEFCFVEFDKFCKKNNIEIHKETPYTPKKNEVVEKMNKMLMERVRGMLSGVDLEKKFWAKEIAIACYLINMSPTSYIVDKTPMEVYMRRNISLQHIPIFGCEAYAHMPKEM
jgi:IS30 family transposase